MPNEAVQQFLKQGQRSGLFSAASAQNLSAQLTGEETLTPVEVAARMIEQKVLTPFQAEQLLAGRGDECLVAGRYQILEKLGEGGMGTVYKAHDTQLDREVAVKVLPAQRLNDADAIARFQREARALAKLSHPNIIQAYDSGEDKGRHFLVMEYVEGASLWAILREQGAIPPTLSADMIYQAALGLQHAHEKGLVHRDLKPANLLLSSAQSLAGRRAPAIKDLATPAPQHTTSYVAPAALSKGIVKILDLGLARFLQDQLGDSHLTKEGFGVGTPDYMAPEQFRDALHADVRTDIYGLGCTLYQLISGTVPFPGSSFSEKADAHAKKEPIPLEERCPEVPAGLAFVVSKMMAKHPADRFQTAAEVAEALAPYIAGASHSMILLRQTMRFHAGQLTMRAPNPRKRLLAWAGAAVAFTSFVGLLILAWPSISPFSSHRPQNDSQAQTSGLASAGSEVTKPKVIIIENGLTVAKDGTGQYTTIGEALEKVRPGMTIRVLDKGPYDEGLALTRTSSHARLTLEAAQKALIVLPRQIDIRDVPGVTLRGFHLKYDGKTDQPMSHVIQVFGACPGLLLEGLDLQPRQGIGIGSIDLWGLNLAKEDAPAVVQNCTCHGIEGIRIMGVQSDQKSPLPCGQVMLRNNTILDAERGILLVGAVHTVQILGNRIAGASMAIILDGLDPEREGVLIANNTVVESKCAVWALDKSTSKARIQLVNNLFLSATQPDMLVVERGPRVLLPSNGAGVLQHWTMRKNWRETKIQKGDSFAEKAWIPRSSEDIVTERVKLRSRVVEEAGYLQPPKDSPLATGGAGGDLPSYVGAVPPEGVEPWDWDKTWKARVRDSEQKKSKTDKD